MSTTTLTKEEKRTQRALKSYKHRGLKNFFIWLWGVISFLIILALMIVITMGVIPLKSLFGEEKAGDVADKTMLEFVLELDQYSFGDAPFTKDFIDMITGVEIIQGKPLNSLIRFKTDDIYAIKITDFANRLTSDPGNLIEVIATLDGVVGLDSLGDFKGLNAFSSWDKVTTTVDPTATDFVPQLYYYKDGDNYLRAFNDDNTRIAPESASLYYPALAYVPIPQALGFISERLGAEKITNLIETLGGAEFGEDSVLSLLLADTTVSGVGDITLDDVDLALFLPEENNSSLYSILRGAAGLKPSDPVTIASLDGMDMSKVKLSGFLDPEEYSILFDILKDSTGKAVTSITVADLDSIDITKTKLSALIDVDDEHNQTLFNILQDVTGKSKEDITINHLAEFDLNGVKLTALFSKEDNEVIYNILTDKTGKTADQLTIEDIQSLDMNSMKLSSVLDPVKNAELFEFLSDNLPGNPSKDELSIGDLASFTMDDIKLSSVLPYQGNETTYKLLLSSISGKTKDTLAVKDLNNFNINDVKLQDILGSRTDNLYTVLCQAAKVNSPDELKVSSLTSSTFSINNVELETLVSGEDELFKILRDATYKDADDKLTIADLSSFDLNNVSLSNILSSPEAHLKELIEDACDIHPYENIKLRHLTDSSFDIDRVYLYHIMEADPNLKEILENVYGLPYNEIKFSHIHNVDGSTPFDLSKLKLSTIVKEDTGNPIFDCLRHDDTVTIANIGEKLDALSLYQVYGENIFTTSTTNAVDTTRKFKKVTEDGKVQFVLDNAGTYYINSKAGVWLILCFDGENHSNGAPTKYVQSDLTIYNMQYGYGLSDILAEATVKELIDAGIINAEVSNPAVLSMTITQVIETLS